MGRKVKEETPPKTKFLLPIQYKLFLEVHETPATAHLLENVLVQLLSRIFFSPSHIFFFFSFRRKNHYDLTHRKGFYNIKQKKNCLTVGYLISIMDDFCVSVKTLAEIRRETLALTLKHTFALMFACTKYLGKLLQRSVER